MRVSRRVMLLTAAAGAASYVRRVYRFRDPARFPAPQLGEVLSPADGVVSLVRRIEFGRIEQLNQSLAGLMDAPMPLQDGWLLGVLIRPLDVHYTYLPISGGVTHTHHRDGAALGLGLAKMLPLAAQQPTDLLDTPGLVNNERYSYTVQGHEGNVTVTQIGFGRPLAAITYLQGGDDAKAGNKATFLPEGGLILLHLPALYTPKVQVGQRVLGAESILAASLSAPHSMF